MNSSEEAANIVTQDSQANSTMKVVSAREALEKRVLQEQVLVGPYESKIQLIRLINGGSFGQIFLGEKVGSEDKVAVKIEHPGQMEQLLYEGQVYRKLQGGPGIPIVSWYGMHGSLFNVLIMDLLGPSLQELFSEASRKFSLKTVLLLADQMLDTISYLHDNQFVHRDISSNNFMMGLGDNGHKLYLVDYGLAKKINSPQTFRPGKMGGSFKFRISRPMVGTARFCSVFCQRGEEESRRDDMESLGFLWLYLLNGTLPWQGVQAVSHGDKLDKIYELKISTTLDALCEGLPSEFLTYMTFVRGLGQYDVPDYNAIKKLFRSLAASRQIEYDFCYDWSILSQGIVEVGEEENSLLRCPRTISTCSSSPSDGAASH